MKYALLMLIAVCFSCEKGESTVKSTSDDVKAYIIGYTGGWGGGPAYKLEGGQLFRSAEDRFLGTPDDILDGIEFRLLEDGAKLQAMTAVMAEYPATVFDSVAPKFDCAEMAWDGVCPYLIILTETGGSKAWTRSESDEATPFSSYLDEIAELLQTLSQ